MQFEEQFSMDIFSVDKLWRLFVGEKFGEDEFNKRNLGRKN